MRKLRHLPKDANIPRIIKDHNDLVDQHNEVKEELRTLKRNLRKAATFPKTL